MATTDQMEHRILVTCADAARLLSISPRDVRELCQDGVLAYGRHGERILIRLTDVHDYAATMTSPAEDRRPIPQQRLEELVDAATGKAARA